MHMFLRLELCMHSWYLLLQLLLNSVQLKSLLSPSSFFMVILFCCDWWKHPTMCWYIKKKIVFGKPNLLWFEKTHTVCLLKQFNSLTHLAYVAIAFLSFLKMHLPAFRIYLRLRRTYFMFLQSCVSSQTKKQQTKLCGICLPYQISTVLLIGIKGGPRNQAQPWTHGCLCDKAVLWDW